MTPHPTAETLRAWMKESGRHFKGAAKHFGISRAAVVAILDGVAPALAPPPTREAPRMGRRSAAADHVTAMPVLERLEWQLGEAYDDLQSLKDNEKATTAIGTMHSRILMIGVALDEERARLASLNQAPEHKMSEEQLVRAIAEGIEEVPEDLLDLVLEAVRARTGGLRLVDAS